MKLSEWLVKRSVQAIRLQPNQAQLIMYIGNEAGDLDSGESIFLFSHQLCCSKKFFLIYWMNFASVACCALALSYAMSQVESGSTLHLPFLHYPKSHFNLKTEVAHAFKQVNVDADQLLYLHDELDELNEMHQLNRYFLDIKNGWCIFQIENCAGRS